MSDQNSTVFPQQLSDSPNKDNSDKVMLKQEISAWLKHEFNQTEFPELVKAVFSMERSQQIYGTIGIRKLLSGQNIPIQEVINANLVPTFIQFMQNDKIPHLQLEATWVLTNVACGTTQQTKAIVNKGGIPCFVRLLRSPTSEIAEQAVWAIGNISGDSAVFRDMILQSGGLEPLLDIVNHSTLEVIIKTGAWAISNLCRGKPPPEFELVRAAIPTLCKAIKTLTNPEVLSDASWALSYLSDNDNSVDPELAKEMIPTLLKYIDTPSQAVAIPCLRTLGNVTRDDINKNVALSVPDYIPKLMKLAIDGRSTRIQREACWNISKITAGDSNQIGAVMTNPYYVDMLLRLTTHAREDIQLEVASIFSNATERAKLQQLTDMVELGVLDYFMHLLSSESTKIVVVAAQGLLSILDKGAAAALKGNTKNDFLDMLIDKGGVEKVENLQSHPDDQVYKIALKILENHFEIADVDWL